MEISGDNISLLLIACIIFDCLFISTPKAIEDVPRAKPRGTYIHRLFVSASLDEQFMSQADLCTLLSIPLNRGLSDMNGLSKVLRVIYRIS